jgi:hypothetical protein
MPLTAALEVLVSVTLTSICSVKTLPWSSTCSSTVCGAVTTLMAMVLTPTWKERAPDAGVDRPSASIPRAETLTVALPSLAPVTLYFTTRD